MSYCKEKSCSANSTGRPSKEPEDTFEAKTIEEKQKYSREKKQVETSMTEVTTPSRTTQNSTSPNTKRRDERCEYLKDAQQKHRSQSTDVNMSYRSRSTSPDQKRGRPCLGETPMTPRTLSA